MSWNRYSYVLGDPVNHSDRTGLDCTDPDDPCYCDPDNGCYDPCQPIADALVLDPSWGLQPLASCAGGGGGGGGGDEPQWVYLGEDGSGKPASARDRTRDAIWMGQDLSALKGFKTSSSPCLQDLSLFGLTSSGVQSIAKSINLVNVATAPPIIQSNFPQGADFAAYQFGNANYLVYNQNEFWQSSSNQVSGTLLHEIIHFSNYSLSDQQIANKLGVKITAQDDSAISLKLATDCFPTPDSK
jgi:hypothetical protein